MALAVRLMGAVTLIRDGRTVSVGGPKQQLLLAVLALSAGRRVSTDRLIDSLWGEDPPATARRTVQSYIASLRRAFGSDAPLHPSQNGYALDIDRADVDLLAFEDTVTGLLAGAGGEAPNDIARELLDVLATWDTPLGSLREAPNSSS
jgi:DNA-binding SARP family transcriptional activator